MIHADWIQHVIEHPGREVIRTDGRIRRWAPIGEMDGSHLRVVLLSDGEAVHDPFFDHSLSAMKVKYFQDTDTLYIGFRVGGVVEEDGNETRSVRMVWVSPIETEGRAFLPERRHDAPASPGESTVTYRS